MDFFTNHVFEFLTVFSSAAISLISLGVFKARFLVLEEKVNRMDAVGSRFTGENNVEVKSKLQFLENRVENLEDRHEKVMSILHEIRSDVKVVEHWIQTQNKPNARH